MLANEDEPFGRSNQKCVRLVYSQYSQPDRRITFTNTGMSGDKPNQKITGVQGSGQQAENGSGNITVRFPYVPRDGIYKVIDTDGGKSYSIVYGCSYIFGVKRAESVFVLTREALQFGTAQWEKMMKKVLVIIENKFKYEGGEDKYWSRDWYNFTEQGSEKCDYTLTYEDSSIL